MSAKFPRGGAGPFLARSLLCGKSDLLHLKELILKEKIRSLWEQILSFREVPILKRYVLVENHCLIQ